MFSDLLGNYFSIKTQMSLLRVESHNIYKNQIIITQYNLFIRLKTFLLSIFNNGDIFVTIRKASRYKIYSGHKKHTNFILKCIECLLK